MGRRIWVVRVMLALSGSPVLGCVPPPEAPLRPQYPAPQAREWPDRESRGLRGPVKRVSQADGTWEEYDPDGRLVRERTAHDFREYRYDERGRLTDRHTEREPGQERDESALFETRRYDPAGHSVEVVIAAPGSGRVTPLHLVLDSHGRTVERWIQAGVDGGTSKVAIVSFDTSGFAVRELVYTPGGPPAPALLDACGRPGPYAVSSDGLGKVPLASCNIFTRDDQGYELRRVKYEGGDAAPTATCTRYDRFGQTILVDTREGRDDCSSRFAAFETYSITRFRRAYDTRGNWVSLEVEVESKRRGSEKQVSRFEQKRKIEYFR
jgi:YD repeat-containing protein